MKAAILTYHNIAVPPEGTGQRGLYVTPSQFRFHLWYLKAAGFTVVPLSTILDYLKGGQSKKRMVALTFDDGYEDFHLHAYPLLKRYGYPSTVFIVSGLAGQDNAWDADRIGVRKKLMDWNAIKGLAQDGVVFGSHTAMHPSLVRVSLEEAERELCTSKKEIEERIGCPVEYFCYPYGDWSGEVRELVRGAGYVAAVTTGRGPVVAGDDPWALRRVSIKLTTHPLSFLYKLHTSSEKRKGARR